MTTHGTIGRGQGGANMASWRTWRARVCFFFLSWPLTTFSIPRQQSSPLLCADTNTQQWEPSWIDLAELIGINTASDHTLILSRSYSPSIPDNSSNSDSLWRDLRDLYSSSYDAGMGGIYLGVCGWTYMYVLQHLYRRAITSSDLLLTPSIIDAI